MIKTIAITCFSSAVLFAAWWIAKRDRKRALRPPLSIISWRYSSDDGRLTHITARDSASNHFNFSRRDGKWRSANARLSDYIILWLETESKKISDDDDRNKIMLTHIKTTDR